MKKKPSNQQMVTEPKYTPEQIHEFIYGKLVDPKIVAEQRKAVRSRPIRDVIRDIQDGKAYDPNPSPATKRKYADPKTLIQKPEPQERREDYVPLTEEDDEEE